MRVIAKGSSIKIQRVGEYLYVDDLQGEGLQGTLWLLALVKKLRRKLPVFLLVAEDNPRKEELMKIYARRLGAKTRVRFMEVT